MKLCKDCRWANQVGPYCECRHPEVMLPAERSPVTGEMTEPILRECGIARISQECGPDGKMWEPKESGPKGFV
jgi:hypothetical protein